MYYTLCHNIISYKPPVYNINGSVSQPTDIVLELDKQVATVQVLENNSVAPRRMEDSLFFFVKYASC